jgi:hypothetical protein
MDTYLSSGNLRAGRDRQARIAEKNRLLQEQRDRDAAAMREGGFIERSGSRFMSAVEPGTPLLRDNSHFAVSPVQVPIQEPIAAPVGQPTKPVEDFGAAKEAFHKYHTGPNSERGKWFVEFGRAIGLIPATATGVTGGQKQADAVAAVLYDEMSFFKYDRAGEIHRTPQAPLTQ